jgi:cation diffusion facilitator family transporter
VTAWLIRHFVKNPANTADQKVRSAYGTLGSVTGVAVNVLLSAVKFLLGLLSGSLAITADAVNNLSDAAGSVMSLISVRLAGKPDDREHPFGHGRMEYLGALAVGALIVLAGGKLLYEGVNGIIRPTALTVGLPVLVLLPVSILVKLWLFFYYRFIARAINSETLLAASKDSVSDVAATSAVLVSVVLQMLFGWRIDGYISALVALFVLKTGLNVCKDTVDRLLGEKPSPTLTRDIKQELLAYEGIRGVHDLVVHDYGPGRCIASVHAEVSATEDIVAIHEVIDKAERDLQNKLGITVTIHMDPTVTDDPAVNDVHKKIAAYLHRMDERLTLHDFRMVPGQKKTSLVFDCLLPDGYTDRDGLERKLSAYAKELDPRYEVVVQFDTDFT